MQRTDTVQVDIQDGTAVVRLHRPAVMNAVNAELRAALGEQLRALDANRDVGAIVLTGSGERAFCGGQDLDESATIDTDTLAGWLNRQHAMYQAVRDVSKPIVAALNGTAVGAGFQMALMCDLRVAHPTLRMGQPEVKAGLASIVGSYLMTLHVGMTHNVQMSLSGELISGQRAYEIGLVTELAAPAELASAAMARARKLAALPATAVRLSKQRLRAITQAPFDEACVAGIRAQLECYAAGEPQQAMTRFLAARGPATPSRGN